MIMTAITAITAMTTAAVAMRVTCASCPAPFPPGAVRHPPAR